MSSSLAYQSGITLDALRAKSLYDFLIVSSVTSVALAISASKIHEKKKLIKQSNVSKNLSSEEIKKPQMFNSSYIPLTGF